MAAARSADIGTSHLRVTERPWTIDLREIYVRPGFYGKMPVPDVEYHITQYDLEQGALEIQYIEEFFGEFPRKKMAAEIVDRLQGRAHLILLASAPLADDSGSVVPVSFKVAHEIKVTET